MGISAQELRIGTITQDKINKKKYLITANALRYLIEAESNDLEVLIEPIPLTEEWLLKMGFEKEIDDSSFIRKVYYYINDFEVEFHGNKLVFRVENKHVTNYFAHHTKYVHQLQNLYFALTGEELELKSE